MPQTTAMQSAPPLPVPAPVNPSRPTRKQSTGLRTTQPPPRTGASPMSFGAAMSGISFNNGGGASYGDPRSYKWGNAVGSYGARFYNDGGDSPQMPFGTSVNMMDPSSFTTSSAAFNLPSSALSASHRRSYAAAVQGRERDFSYNPNALSASLASLSTNPMGSMGRSYSRPQIESLMAVRSDAELTKEYECCGQKHAGLHALLEHFEEQHPYSDPNIPDAGFSPVTLAMDLDLEAEPEIALEPSRTVKPGSASSRGSTSPRPVPSYPIPAKVEPAPAAATPLKLSDVLASPPEGEASFKSQIPTAPSGSTASSLDASLPTPTTSAHPSPPFAPKITPASRGAFFGAGTTQAQPANRFERAFNEVVAASNKNAPSGISAGQPTAVAPNLLFAPTPAAPPPAPQVTPAQAKREAPSATPSAAPTENGADTDSGDEGAAEGGDQAASGAADKLRTFDAALHQPSLFANSRAWRCPNPGCNKSYRQSNGLKYHLQKGQCDFAIHDALDSGLTLEEAEERARPYVCAVGAGCNKRYRQMNGLKYHYLNSGEHGEYGLRMLQNGTHPQPPSFGPTPTKRQDTSAPPTPQTAAPTTSTATPTRGPAAHAPNGAGPAATATTTPRPSAAAPYAVPNRAAQATTTPHAGPRMGTWPAQQRTHAPGAQGVSRPAISTNPQALTPAATTTGSAVSTPAGSTATTPVKMVPVQRGRDAVLFSALDPLDV